MTTQSAAFRMANAGTGLFLKALVAGVFVLGSTVMPVEAAAPRVASQAHGYYRNMIGDFEVTVLSDGTAPREVDKIMKPQDKVLQALKAAHETSPVDMSINAFLINTGAKLILVDTGAGELFGPHSGGLLIGNLRASGYQPEQVDAVLLTHIHADHSGGLSIGGKPVFPNAVVYVDKRDPDFWLSTKAEAANPDKKQTFKQSHQTVDPYVLAGKLRPFDGSTELFPGIRSVPAYGHTPGHTAYMIESQGQRLLLWGDIVHLSEVQFAHPEVSIEYDVAPTVAIETRRRFLADAAHQGYLVGGAHIAFPGLGHVRAVGNGYEWAPAPYIAMQ